MAVSSDISLPSDQEPAWPHKCIVCRRPPDTRLWIAYHRHSGLLVYLVPFMLLFGWQRVWVPICQGCKPKFYFQRWGREAILLVLAILCFGLIYPYFEDWPSYLRKLAIAAAIILAAIPIGIWEVFLPRYLTVSAEGDEVHYAFAFTEYAAAFAAANSPEAEGAENAIERESAGGPVATSPGSPGLCVALLRDGWHCHRFAETPIVVALPHDFVAAFDKEGVLMGTLDGQHFHFSATLHRHEAMIADPPLAYQFLEHLAKKAGMEITEKGTYSYFRDPKTTGDEALEYDFYVVAVPGAVVVISLASPPGEPRPAKLAEIEAAIPDLIGELV